MEAVLWLCGTQMFRGLNMSTWLRDLANEPNLPSAVKSMSQKHWTFIWAENVIPRLIFISPNITCNESFRLFKCKIKHCNESNVMKTWLFPVVCFSFLSRCFPRGEEAFPVMSSYSPPPTPEELSSDGRTAYFSLSLRERCILPLRFARDQASNL